MKILVDNETTKETIYQLCDIAIKTSGIQNLDAIQTIIKSISIDESIVIPPKPKKLEEIEGLNIQKKSNTNDK